MTNRTRTVHSKIAQRLLPMVAVAIFGIAWCLLALSRTSSRACQFFLKTDLPRRGADVVECAYGGRPGCAKNHVALRVASHEAHRSLNGDIGDTDG